jgi:protease-4
LFFLLLMAGMGTMVIVFISIMVIAVGGGEARISGEKIGIVEIKGAIVDSQLILRQIKEFREAEAVKAIVVRVDSPGGSVGPSQEIYREIRKTVEKKKVIVSMGAVAASGGYYVAAAADRIVANPGTITGSIGVIMGFTNFEELMKKIGLSPVVIKSGEYKDLGSPARAMTDREKELLESMTQKIHQQFVSAIVDGRGLERGDVEAVADGRIISGEDAHELGLIDRLGNYQDAVEWAAELGGITGKIETVFPEKEKPPFVEYLMESALTLISREKAQSKLTPQMRLQR